MMEVLAHFLCYQTNLRPRFRSPLNGLTVGNRPDGKRIGAWNQRAACCSHSQSARTPRRCGTLQGLEVPFHTPSPRARQWYYLCGHHYHHYHHHHRQQLPSTSSSRSSSSSSPSWSPSRKYLAVDVFVVTVVLRFLGHHHKTVGPSSSSWACWTILDIIIIMSLLDHRYHHHHYIAVPSSSSWHSWTIVVIIIMRLLGQCPHCCHYHHDRVNR